MSERESSPVFTEETIRAEMEDFRLKLIERYGTDDKWMNYYFNNFILHLNPNNDFRKYRLESDQKDIPTLERLSKGSLDEKKRFLKRGYSKRYLRETSAQFFVNVDAARAKAGLTEGQLVTLVETTTVGGFYADSRIQQSYICLRLQGYHHYPDLTG